MAEIRTRKLKAQVQETGIGAAVPKVQYSYRFSESASKKAATWTPSETKAGQARPHTNSSPPTDALFSYDTKYIFRDIRRTTLIATFILLLLAFAKVLLVYKGL